MILIDGTAGGGQLVRTALTLSVLTDVPFRIDEIRGSRPNPGLRPQHLAAVDLVGELCDAEVYGNELDSESLTFRPGDACRTSLRVDLQTAGSLTLLFDAVVPIAAVTDEPFRVTATGGTDVEWAPTIGYQRRVKLALLATAGLQADIEVRRTGFYPAGGGKATLQTTPAELSSIERQRRGDLHRVEVYSKAAEVLAERNVADRQATHAAAALEDAGFDSTVADVRYVSTQSAGSALLLRGVYEHTLAGVDALGRRGRTSEAVADGAVREFEAFHGGGAPVDEHMADQLMIFLALVGGSVRIPTVTEHVRTNLEVLDQFGSDVRLDCQNDGTAILTASAHPETTN